MYGGNILLDKTKYHTTDLIIFTKIFQKMFWNSLSNYELIVRIILEEIKYLPISSVEHRHLS